VGGALEQAAGAVAPRLNTQPVPAAKASLDRRAKSFGAQTSTLGSALPRK
jgi:hypothetical protein